MAKNAKPQAPAKPARAPTRRVPPPKQPKEKGGGPPIVLIIFLVFFILTSLILGVFLYLAKDKIDLAQKEAAKQKDETKKWQDAERFARQYMSQKLRAWIDGTAVDAQGARSLADMESEWKDPGKTDPRNDAEYKWVAGMAALLQGDINGKDADAKKGLIGPYNDQDGKNATSLREVIDNLKKQITTLTSNLKEEQDKLAKKTKELADYKVEFNRDVVDAAVRQQQVQYEKQIKDRVAEKQKLIDDLNKKMGEVSRDFEKALTDNKKTTDATIAKKDEEIKETKRSVDEERAAIKKTQQAAEELAIDKVRGRVIRAEGGTQNVYIDVGSDHRVNPGLKFSVRAQGPGGKPGKEPKAMLEVISIVGPGVSLARITRVAKPEFSRSGTDPNTNKPIDPTTEAFWITDPKQFWNSRDPVAVGDLLFNPLWDPKEPVHVVLAGFFDLDGDGSDDLDFFRRYLTDVGVQVDGYLDPNTENLLKGRLDYQTDYLIVGGLPILVTGPTAPALKDQVAQASGGPTGKAVAELNKQAIEKGVAVVRLKDFLAKMGFSTLRLPNPRVAAPVTGGAPAAGENKEEGAKKPVKKEEEEEAPKKKD